MTFFSNLLAPLARRRRKVTITTKERNRSPPPSPPQEQEQQKGELQPEFKPTTSSTQEHHVVILEPRISITSSTSVNVDSLEFKASQELAVSLNTWDDYQPAVMPSFPAFEHLLRQQQEEEQRKNEQRVPRRSLRRLPRPLSLYRPGNKSLKMARSTPNFHK